MKTIKEIFALKIHDFGNSIAEVGDGSERFYVRLSALNKLASKKLIEASEATDGNDHRYVNAYDEWCVKNSLQDVWTIQASYYSGGTLVDCSSAETLGTEFLYYASERRAIAKAKRMEKTQKEFGLKGVFYSTSLI